MHDPNTIRESGCARSDGSSPRTVEHVISASTQHSDGLIFVFCISELYHCDVQEGEQWRSVGVGQFGSCWYWRVHLAVCYFGSNPIHCYRLDEAIGSTTMRDSRGTLSGTLLGNPTLGAEGAFGPGHEQLASAPGGLRPAPQYRCRSGRQWRSDPRRNAAWPRTAAKAIGQWQTLEIIRRLTFETSCADQM